MKILFPNFPQIVHLLTLIQVVHIKISYSFKHSDTLTAFQYSSDQIRFPRLAKISDFPKKIQFSKHKHSENHLNHEQSKSKKSYKFSSPGSNKEKSFSRSRNFAKSRKQGSDKIVAKKLGSSNTKRYSLFNSTKERAKTKTRLRKLGRSIKIIKMQQDEIEVPTFDMIDLDILDAEDGINNDPSENMTPLNRKYDKACLYLEYQQLKRNARLYFVSNETKLKIQSQNRQLSDFFVKSISVTSPQNAFPAKNAISSDQRPSRGFKLLELTRKIFFSHICVHPHHPSKSLVPDDFVDYMQSLFLKLYSITRTSWDKAEDDYLSPDDFMGIKNSLEKCDGNKNNGTIKWFVDECSETVLASDKENNYPCTPFPEVDFNTRKYDPILDFVWHQIVGVYGHCLSSFKPNIELWKKYAFAMAEMFPDEMLIRWSSSWEENGKFYTRLLGPDAKNYFVNMNRCMYAANLRSKNSYIPRRFEKYQELKLEEPKN